MACFGRRSRMEKERFPTLAPYVKRRSNAKAIPILGGLKSNSTVTSQASFQILFLTIVCVYVCVVSSFNSWASSGDSFKTTLKFSGAARKEFPNTTKLEPVSKPRRHPPHSNLTRWTLRLPTRQFEPRASLTFCAKKPQKPPTALLLWTPYRSSKSK